MAIIITISSPGYITTARGTSTTITISIISSVPGTLVHWYQVHWYTATRYTGLLLPGTVYLVHCSLAPDCSPGTRRRQGQGIWGPGGPLK